MIVTQYTITHESFIRGQWRALKRVAHFPDQGRADIRDIRSTPYLQAKRIRVAKRRVPLA